jgi:sulfotransferase family protein
MARPLDFIIFGVPRSGTKALVRGLNLHPHVYCAQERFHFGADHSRLVFPESFLDSNSARNTEDIGKIESIAEGIAGKDVHHAGNKLPRYYFALDRINREIPGLKNIWIYRSPYGFIPSWNRREQDRDKGQWPVGQIGLFGLLELFCCIENCLNLKKDIFIFPYNPGLGRSPETILQTLTFLGADPAVYDRRAFEKEQRRQGKKRKRRGDDVAPLPLQDHEKELLAVLRVGELDSLMEQGRGLMLSEIALPLRDYLDSVTEVLPEAVDRAFMACGDRAVTAFGREYFQRHRTELSGFSQRARGSERIARFQRFGAYDRLKALYVQRSAWRRRLFDRQAPGGEGGLSVKQPHAK